MNNSSVGFAKRFVVHRRQFHPKYDIQLDGGGLLQAEIESDNVTHKLTLRRGGDVSGPIAVSHLPLAAETTYLRFRSSNSPHNTYWEEMQKVRKLPWEDPDREEYHWTTQLSEGSSRVQFMWISRVTEGIQAWEMGRRSYTLVDLQTNEIAAECIRNSDLLRGGELEFNELWRRRGMIPDERVLMTFLAIYEMMRRRNSYAM